MERSSEEEDAEEEEAAAAAAFREEDAEESTCSVGPAGGENGGGDALTPRLPWGHQEISETRREISAGLMSKGGEELEPERDVLSASHLSQEDAYTSSPHPNLHPPHHHDTEDSSSSSSSSGLCLTPVLPPSVELGALLADTRLTLDVYQGGAAALPLLWSSVPEQLRGLNYLRLGSEDKAGLDGASDVLPHLTELRSLAIRGHCFYDQHGEPLPGLLTSLPSGVSSLSRLVHLDLSFNQLVQLPPCLLALPVLSYLLLCHNRLCALPADVGRLSSLTYLSLLGNHVASLPPSLSRLKALRTLDVSHNLLQQLPDEIGCLEELVRLELSHNRLKDLPESLGSLLSLRELVICSNDLRRIPPSLHKLPLLKIDVRDNPLGRPPTPPPLPPTPGGGKAKIPELHLGAHQRSFIVTPAGCHVFLPGGAELLFPPGSLVSATRLQWLQKRPERKWVWLEEHDILLSRPLELRPHGITFRKPVEVCVPHHRASRRQVVVRRFDGRSWSTLPTVLRRGSERHCSHPDGRPARLACCSVSHFSWFVVVSRPVTDTCSVTAAGALLVCSSDPGVKLCFPPSCTAHARSVTLQVLHVSVADVQALCGDPQISVSPLLCLSQTPDVDFLQQVKVQVPLPPGVTGHTLDMSCLHLMHGDPTAQTWTEITSQVNLFVTHLYAVFYVSHFSWYWLWYTTQRCVSGVVRRVYQRLKQFKVQFFVLQRRMDPTQVLLQCLPTNKVDSRVQALSEQYDGPQPSDLCDLLEGEQFFAGFEKGLDISSERPDCVGGRLCFVFYSSLKNVKEVFICPAQGLTRPVRGQVSFYRGEIPSNLPEEAARKRKGHDSQWLATLPLRLPAVDTENSYVTEQIQHPPLNLGDPESGYLTEANLLSISLQIGADWRIIGLNLGLSYQDLERMQYHHRDNLGELVLAMLFQWARRQKEAGPGAVTRLVDAMVESSRRDIADEIEDILSLGRRKYSESLRRVGLEGLDLEGQGSAEEPTLATDG